MPIKYINQMDIKNKRVLIRVDFNVPLDKNGNITDDTRIRSVLTTVNYAADEGAKVILMSHLGRPKGQVKVEMSLKPVARYLTRKYLDRNIKKTVSMAPDCVGPEVDQMVAEMKPGDILLLENLRFHPGEEKNDPEFARQLAKNADVYINDAFATAHRGHASNVAILDYVPECGAGFLMKNEIEYFNRAMENPTRPLVAILGGAKVSEKIPAIENLIPRVDKVLIGGGMAFTFLKTLGYEVGNSLVDNNYLETAQRIMDRARELKVKFYLPVDCVAADKFDPQAVTKITTVQEIPEGWMGLDIGPATGRLYAEALQDAQTIIWNGPMGAFEMENFSRGTFYIVNLVAESSALTIVGGGDTDVAINKRNAADKVSYISTGGGAFIEWLQGKSLPGITALEQKSCSA